MERTLAAESLLTLRGRLDHKAKHTAIEQEYLVGTQSIVEKLIEKGRKQGLREGRTVGLREGRTEGLRKGRSAGRTEGLHQGLVIHARAMLRRILAGRGLAPSRKEEALIDGCEDVATLDRWIEQALTAESAAEALGPGAAPARRRRNGRSS